MRAFLYYAINAGMDMGIVNAGQLAVYDDLPKPLLEAVEDVLFNRREDATDRLVNLANTLHGKGKKKQVSRKWRKSPVEERLRHAPRRRHPCIRGNRHRGSTAEL